MGAHILTAAPFKYEADLDRGRTVLLKCSVGDPGPTFVPSFLPVSESTEF